MSFRTTFCTPEWHATESVRGYWEVEVLIEYTPGWLARILGKRPSMNRQRYAALCNYRDIVSYSGWINTHTRQSVDDGYLRGALRDRVEALLREEEFAKAHAAIIDRTAQPANLPHGITP